MGMDAAEQCAGRFIPKIKPNKVIFTGIAGAYSSNLAIGELLEIRYVLDHRTSEKYTVNDEQSSGVMIRADKITYEKEYLDYLDSNHVIAIDMEAAAIASVCKKYGVPLYVYKAVSDRVEISKPDGSPNLKAVAIYLLKKLWRIPYLIKLGIGTNQAIKTSTHKTIEIINKLP